MLNTTSKKRAERQKQASPTQEVVPYLGFVRPGLILNKDGSLLAIYAFDGADLDSTDNDTRGFKTNALDNAFRAFNGRITLWWTVVHRRSREYPKNSMPSDVGQTMDQWHGAIFESGALFSNRQFLSVLFTPDQGVEKFFEKIRFYSGPGGRSLMSAAAESAKDMLFKRNAYAYQQAELDQSIRRFEGMLESFEGSAAAVLRLRRLELQTALAALHVITNPASPDHPVVMPTGLLLDGYIADNQVTVGADHLVFEHPAGRCLASALSVKSWPDEATWPGMLQGLLSIPGEFVLTQTYRFLDQEVAEKRLKAARRHFVMTQKSMLVHVKDAILKTDSDVDRGKLMLLSQAEDALAAATGENVQFGLSNLSVLALGRNADECDETLKLIAGVFNRRGFLTIKEKLNLFSSWAGSLPGQWEEQPRRQLVSLPNTSDTAPIFTLHQGDRINQHLSEQAGVAQPALTLFQTRYGIPYWFNVHQGQLGHALIVGPSGAGKSVFVNFLISQYQKYAPTTFIFDKNKSAKIPTILQGGAHIDITANRVDLNPLSLIGDRKHWPWLAGWLEILITSRGYEVTASDEKDIWRALESLESLGPDKWQLSSLAALLPSHLVEQVRGWCEGGSLGHLFDHPQDGFKLGGFTCIEMGDIVQNYPRAAGAFLEYAFRRIDESLDGRRPGLIYVEEAWFLLADKVFVKRLDDWLRTLRKKNTVVWLATQSLKELESSPIFSSILDNIPTQIFLPNPKAKASAPIYKGCFDLADWQIDEIARATPQQEYYLVNRQHSRMLQVSFGKELLACLRSDGRAITAFERWMTSGESDWRERYVHEVTSER